MKFTAREILSLREQVEKECSVVLDRIDVSENDPITAVVRKTAHNAFGASLAKLRFIFDTMSIVAQIAETPVQKMAGLEVFAYLNEFEGLAFPFKNEHVSFHMGSVQFPIDIIFLMEDGENQLKIAKIVEWAEPGTRDTWQCSDVAMVLEVGAGTCDKFNIQEGSVCQIRQRVSL